MIQLSAQVLEIKSKVDRTLNVKLNTQELSATDAGVLYDLTNKQVWIGIDEAPIKSLDVPEETLEFRNDKSLSERLRNIIYVYWESKTDKKQDFETFRRVYMEKIINNVKSKLN